MEHFVPITEDAAQTFRWLNLLWVCPECNRKKNNQFLRDARGPLLVDPATTDPWEHIVLDAATGNLAPRFVAADEVDPFGEATLRVLDILNYEVVVEGRLRAIRRLRDAMTLVANTGDSQEARRRVVDAVGDDEFGVAAWFARCAGNTESPFREAAIAAPALWRRFVKVAAVAELGRNPPP